MRMNLKRIDPDDGLGIVGAMIMTHIKWDADGKVEHNLELEKPTVGWQMRLDSLSHWWHVTYIKEIISEESTEAYDEVIFRTQNSTYQWRKSK